MEAPPELDILKDIPGFKAILRAVLRSQMQYLASQLSMYGGVETIVLAASLTDCTLSHLSSEGGSGFLEARDDIKSQFLRHCLNKTEQGQSSSNSHHLSTPQPSSSQVAKSWSPMFTNNGQIVMAMTPPSLIGVPPGNSQSNLGFAGMFHPKMPNLQQINVSTQENMKKKVKLNVENNLKDASVSSTKSDDTGVGEVCEDDAVMIKIERVDGGEYEEGSASSKAVQDHDDHGILESELDISDMTAETGEEPSEKAGDNVVVLDDAGEQNGNSNNSSQAENNMADYSESDMTNNMVIISQDGQVQMAAGSVYQTRERRIHKRPPEENVPDCDVCGTRFKNISSYRRHMRKHEGINPYSCNICGQGFYRKDDKNAHVMKHLKNNWLNCSLCGHGVRNLPQLRTHMRVFHQINPLDID